MLIANDYFEKQTGKIENLTENPNGGKNNIETYKNTKRISYVIFKTTYEIVRERGSVYEATRYAWKMSLDRAWNYKYAFGVINGIVEGVYEVERWHLITEGQDKGRVEFFGHDAPREIAEDFLYKAVPENLRGGQNPVRYVDGI